MPARSRGDGVARRQGNVHDGGRLRCERDDAVYVGSEEIARRPLVDERLRRGAERERSHRPRWGGPRRRRALDLAPAGVADQEQHIRLRQARNCLGEPH